MIEQALREEGHEPSETQIRLGRFQMAVALLMLLAGVLVYSHLPARVPVHWNIKGEIDGWADRSIPNLFFQPLLVLVMTLLAWALPRIDPLKRSYRRFQGSYYVIIDVIVAFLALLYGLTLYAAFHQTLPVGTIVPAAVGLLLALMGNQLSKVRRNFFIGIRTPWTLASETVWVRTHRIGARIFVLGGLAATIGAFLPAPWNFITFMICVLGASLLTLLISYLIYHRLEAQGRLSDKIGE